ncbi:uncharacterized protein FMAN_06813 [Fusarium mangiferae]|uniref:RRM domain-containing protein n=1 Tax=Fusarium mangiferae TaxID=192010 RepID=A0A1L7UDI8_FUSMA|nr:uncharacterized protein FMAN_06813 [Fusarium mangiferae]CVL08754.1 uncharacterized protein FMAN_06813 [Fusarium mangiferae]
MSSKLYIGNLAGSTTDESLRKAFGNYGQVLDSIVMRDRDSGNSRGFGLDGNRITVSMANAESTGNSGGAYNGGQGGYGGGYQQGGGYSGGYSQGGYGGGGYGGGN